MKNTPYTPIFELTRGSTVESIHYGAVAVVDVLGNLVSSYGDPQATTFLRSSAKPFQALPFFENQGPELFGLSLPEKAIICASHSGTDDHLNTVRSIQRKAEIDESELMCGVHKPYDEATAERMHDHREVITPNRHNCSGKHSGMLAYTRLLEKKGQAPPVNLPYIDPAHPIQRDILQAFAGMCGLSMEKVEQGIDGCSAPNFDVPLASAALAYARLCSPEDWNCPTPARAKACHAITEAMISNPEMVGGPGRFDTRLMQVTQGRLVSKGGAEGFLGIGLMPDALGAGSPALGIALKISDGDDRGRVRGAVGMEVLRQLGVLSEEEMVALADIGPTFTIENWRKIAVGHAYPSFHLTQPVTT